LNERDSVGVRSPFVTQQVMDPSILRPRSSGFADQAHLTRAFTATIGIPPAAYARQAASSS
jgi:hypothetical protein